MIGYYKYYIGYLSDPQYSMTDYLFAVIDDTVYLAEDVNEEIHSAPGDISVISFKLKTFNTMIKEKNYKKG